MPIDVDIPNVGKVFFDDDMTKAEIDAAIENDILPPIIAERRQKLIGEKAAIQNEQRYADLLLGSVRTGENVLQTIRLSNPFHIARTLAHYGFRAAGVPGFEAPIQDPASGIPFPRPEGTGVMSGVGRFASDLANYATSPEGIAVAASPAAPLLARQGLQAGFGAAMAAAAPTTAAELGKATVEGTAADVTEQSLKLGLELGVSLGSAAIGMRRAITPQFEARMREVFIPRSTPAQWPIILETDSFVPPLQSHSVNASILHNPGIPVSRTIATTPGAMGRIPGLAWLADPRSIDRGPVNDSILQRQYEIEVGKAVQTVLGRQIEGKYERIFGVDKDGRITGVDIPFDDSRYIADFFETLQREPGRYRLNEEQQAAWQEIQGIMDDARSFVEHHKLRNLLDDEGNQLGVMRESNPYFPRQRVFTEAERAEMARPQRTGQSVGAKQTSEKSRLFETESAGRIEGVTYEPTIYKRLVHYVGQLYRIAADERLSETIKPLGETVEARRERYGLNPNLTEREVEILATSARPHEGPINQPALVGRFYPAEVANTINEFYGGERSTTRQRIVAFNQGLKGVTFGFDWGGPFLQGLPLMMTDTAAWGRSVGNGLVAFLDHDYMRRYVENPDNLTAMRELAQLGVPMGRLSEFIPSGEPPGLLKTLHVTGMWQRFQDFQNTFLESGVVELWKAARETLPPEELAQFSETLQNVMLTGRMEGTGLTQNRILAERAMLLAPAFLRGSVSMVAGVAQRGQSGIMLRNTLARTTLGGLLLYLGLAKMSDMDDKEIQNRLDPSRPDFATVRTKLGDKEINIGFGGGLRSLMRLGGEITEAMLTDPSRLTAPGLDKNPILRWLRGKLAPVPSTVVDAIIGRDFLGNEITKKDLLIRQLPLPSQPFLVQEGEPLPPAGEILPGSLGLFMFEESEGKQFQRRREEIARNEYGLMYERLPFEDQLAITAKTKSEPPFNKKPESSKRIKELAIINDEARRKEVAKSLGKERLSRLKELQVQFDGYDSSIRADGIIVPLTKSQMNQFGGFVNEEFAKAIDQFLENNEVKKKDPIGRQEVLNKILSQARATARARYIEAQGQPILVR